MADIDRRARWEKSPLRIFISHDVEAAGSAASQLASDLELLGCAVWLASKDIAPGEQWSPRLEEAIRQSTHTIALIVGRPASGWVKYELGIALDRSMSGDHVLVPVIVEAQADMPSLLSGYQAVDITRSYSAGLHELSAVLGLSEVLASVENAYLERWEAGRAQLQPHRQLLHQQLANLQGVLDAEQRRLNNHIKRAEDARQKAAVAETETAALRAEAQQAAERAQRLSAAAVKAASEVDGRDSFVSGLVVRLDQWHAEHDPVLDRIERAYSFLDRCKKSSPLEAARDPDALILEHPETVIPAAEVSSTARSVRGYLHRHRIASALLAAVNPSLLAVEDYEIVITRGLEAMDEEFPYDVDLPEIFDEDQLKELEESISLVALSYADKAIAENGLGLGHALQLAFAGYSSGLRYAPGHPVSESAPRGSAGRQVGMMRFDVVLMDSLGRGTAIDLIVGEIHTLTVASPELAVTAGYFNLRGLVRNGPFPAVVLRGAQRAVAVKAGSALKSYGARVVVRPSAKVAGSGI